MKHKIGFKQLAEQFVGRLRTVSFPVERGIEHMQNSMKHFENYKR